MRTSFLFSFFLRRRRHLRHKNFVSTFGARARLVGAMPFGGLEASVGAPTLAEVAIALSAAVRKEVAHGQSEREAELGLTTCGLLVSLWCDLAPRLRSTLRTWRMIGALYGVRRPTLVATAWMLGGSLRMAASPW